MKTLHLGCSEIHFAFSELGFKIIKIKDLTLVIGRDGKRISGQMISSLVTATLQGLGINVIDLGLFTTPTVEVMVPELNADGGIILRFAQPKTMERLKVAQRERGIYLSGKDGAEVLAIAKKKILPC